MASWYSLWSIGIYFYVLVCLDQEKSGNPAENKSALSLKKRLGANVAPGHQL
jgi:hypothetical protein